MVLASGFARVDSIKVLLNGMSVMLVISRLAKSNYRLYCSAYRGKDWVRRAFIVMRSAYFVGIKTLFYGHNMTLLRQLGYLSIVFLRVLRHTVGYEYRYHLADDINR